MQNKNFTREDITIREADNSDIPQLHKIRNAVKENVLSDPSRIKDEDYNYYMNECGKGWVAIIDEVIAGFAIVDLKKNNVWALFVDPEFEGNGIGKLLHAEMLDWYFKQTDETIWLSTSPGTRAEKFYGKAGWVHTGNYGSNELRFELNSHAWENFRINQDQIK